MKGYEDRQGLCIQDPPEKFPWRDAISKCNALGGTLTYVDSAEKIQSLQEIMKVEGWGELFWPFLTQYTKKT